jgi:hypothetical protein
VLIIITSTLLCECYLVALRCVRVLTVSEGLSEIRVPDKQGFVRAPECAWVVANLEWSETGAGFVAVWIDHSV